MNSEDEREQPETEDILVGDIKDSAGIAMGNGTQASVIEGDLVHGDKVMGDKVAGNKVIQLIADVPLWLWAVVALAILVLLGFWVVPQVLPPFPPAGEGETLVIVAKFDDRSEGVFRGVDPSSRIYDFVLKAAQDNHEANVRVERLDEPVTSSEDAQTLGRRYRANLVFWGWHDRLGVQPYIELIGERTMQAEGVVLATPTPMAFYFRDEIPAQSAYLGLFTLGMTHIIVESSAELRQAIAFFDAAVASVVEGTHVTPWEAYMWRANCYALLGEYDAALRDYNRDLELNPEDASGFHNRAIAHSRLGDNAAAVADYTEAIRIRPDFAVAYFNRAIAHSSLGDHKAAIADYTEAIRIKPNFAVAYFNRAAAHKDLGDHEAAIADYTEAIRMKPDYVEAYFNRAIAYSGSGDHEAAISDYTEVIRIKPDDAGAYVGRGYEHSTLGDHQAAIADYTDAIRIKPDYVEAYSNRAAALYSLGNYVAAVADCTEAIRIKPYYAGAYFNRGVAFKQLGYVDKAITDFEHFLELSTDAYERSQAEQHLKELREK